MTEQVQEMKMRLFTIRSISRHQRCVMIIPNIGNPLYFYSNGQQRIGVYSAIGGEGELKIGLKK